MRKRKFIILSVFIMLVLIVSTKYLMSKNITSYAINVGDTLNLIGKENSINKILKQTIESIEKEKSKEIVQKAREQRQKELDLQRKSQNFKTAYLTFDDGPSLKSTPLILDILDEYDIKATFFVLGSMAETNPEILKRTYEKGHKIGNHSYSHKYHYLYKNNDNFLQDIKHSEDIFKKVLGEDFETNIIRFPGGSFGKQKAPMRIAAKNAGYNYYDWNSLNGDAEGVNLSKEYLLKRLKETTYNKEKAIILMHDTDSKMKTVETLRESIDYLIQQGFKFEVLQ